MERTVEIILSELIEARDKAQAEGKESFKFKELDFVTRYADYLIEYVRGKGKTKFSITHSTLPEEPERKETASPE